MKPKRILVIAPHADDELLGAGGFLLRRKSEGYRIKLVLVACSDIKMVHSDEVVFKEIREYEFKRAAELLSTEPPIICGFDDSKLDQAPVASLVRILDKELRDYHPDVVLIPEPSYHQDHQFVNRACIAALRPVKSWIPKMILAYEVPTSTWMGQGIPFVPNVYMDIGGFIEDKLNIFREIYRSQYSENGRGMLALDGIRRHATYRGTEIRVDYAEAFVLLRQIIDRP